MTKGDRESDRPELSELPVHVVETASVGASVDAAPEEALEREARGMPDAPCAAPACRLIPARNDEATTAHVPAGTFDEVHSECGTRDAPIADCERDGHVHAAWVTSNATRPTRTFPRERATK